MASTSTELNGAEEPTLVRMRDLVGSLRTRLSTLLSDFVPSRWFDVLAERYPNHPLLHLQEPLHFAGFDGPVLNGRQIRDLGFKMANALIDAGLRWNQRVVIVKRNHVDYLFYIHATVAARGIPVSVNNKTGWKFISAIQQLTDARFLLTDDETLRQGANDPALADLLKNPSLRFLVVSRGCDLDGVPDSPRIRHFVRDIERSRTDHPPERNMADDSPVALFHTSGTTGTPKCCIWDRRTVVRIWKILTAIMPTTPSSRAMITAPCSHQLFFAAASGGLLTGARGYVVSDFEPKACLATIEREKITHFIGFPYTYMRMAAEDLSAYDLSSMRFWSTGADKVHAAHIKKFIACGSISLRPRGPKGSIFLDSYGSTEIGVGGVLQAWFPGSEPEPCVQGTPMPTQFKLRIVDPSWDDLPAGEVGRILVRSSTYFGGYWNQHDRCVETRLDGWWWAGDVGKIDEKGRLHFYDREEDTVLCPKGKVYTLPVEELLLTHPDVMEAAVYQGATDPKTGLGEAIAVVVPRGWLRRGSPGESSESARDALALDLLRMAARKVGSSRVDLQACKLEYSIVSPK